MYVNPMGMPIIEITRVRVALNANVTSPICVFRGSNLLVEARIRSTLEEPTRKRMKVPTRQMSKFRRLWELPALVVNLVRVGLSAVGRYLGRLVLWPTLAS
jgi:hypothetical protein